MSEPTTVNRPDVPDAPGAIDAPDASGVRDASDAPDASVPTGAAATRPTTSAPDVSPAPGTAPASRRHAGRTSRRRLWVVGAVLVGAAAFLLYKGLGSSLDYFETVDQAVAQKAMLGTKTFRLEGVVVPGTVHRLPDGVSFVAAGSKHRVPVINHGSPPQLFQPDIPVVVVGHFAGDTFVSDQLIVDHTAQYVQEYPNRVKTPARIAP